MWLLIDSAAAAKFKPYDERYLLFDSFEQCVKRAEELGFGDGATFRLDDGEPAPGALRSYSCGDVDVGFIRLDFQRPRRELWMEFLGGPNGNLCGLCGQTGFIDTVGNVRTPSGAECGVRTFCICPNGRALKQGYEGVDDDGDTKGVVSP